MSESNAKIMLLLLLLLDQESSFRVHSVCFVYSFFVTLPRKRRNTNHGSLIAGGTTFAVDSDDDTDTDKR
uniref:Putative secreted protein n=1 Tax=Anopheles darlingi TaxID=43151 RepID=A0A2M4DBQ5_ANODA